MITELVYLISFVITIRCQAQYPAGIDPKSCPNYPHCSNPLAAIQVAAPQYQLFGGQPAQPQVYQQPQAHQQPQPYQPQYEPKQQPQYQPQPQYQEPARQPEPQYSPAAQAALDRGEYIGDGDYHGEGLTAESLGGDYNNYNQGQSPVRYTNPQPAPVVEYRQADAQRYNPAAPVPVSPQFTQTQLFSPVQQSPQYNSGLQYSPEPVQNRAPAQSYNVGFQQSQPTFPVQYNAGPTLASFNSASAPVDYQQKYYQQPVDSSQQVQPAQIPAGLDPRACPNYPFCH